jgi:hypothetical protein
MGSGEMKKQQGVVPVLSGFDFDAKCDITSFTMLRRPRRDDPEIIRDHKGGRFNADARGMIQKATPGDIYYFEDIRCKCPGDPASRNLGGMVYRVD